MRICILGKIIHYSTKTLNKNQVLSCFYTLFHKLSPLGFCHLLNLYIYSLLRMFSSKVFTLIFVFFTVHLLVINVYAKITSAI